MHDCILRFSSIFYNDDIYSIISVNMMIFSRCFLAVMINVDRNILCFLYVVFFF
jgi:hypothetical protein